MQKIFMKILSLIYIVLGMISISYYKDLTRFGGYITFSKFWLITGVGLVFLGISKFIINTINVDFSAYNNLFKMLKGVCLIGVIIFLILEALVVYNGCKVDKGKEDYLMILGAGIRGTRLSMSLKERLDEGLIYLKNNEEVKVIVSGGQGEGEDISEAEAMKRYLVQNGINQSRIIKEDSSTSTFENFNYTKKLLDKIDGRENIKLRVVTNNFHMFRSKMLAKRNGFVAYGQPAELYPLLQPNYYVREVFALVKSFIFDRN